MFDSKLGKIEGAGDIGTYLISIVNSKTVASAKPAAKAVTSDNAPEKPTSPEEQKQETSGNEKGETGSA